MAQANKSTRRKHAPAKTPEARENQLIAAAVDLAEKQIREGTASAAVITHYLKLATKREDLETQRIQAQIDSERAKQEAMSADKNAEEMYTNAMKAMREYSGVQMMDVDDDPNIF